MNSFISWNALPSDCVWDACDGAIQAQTESLLISFRWYRKIVINEVIASKQTLEVKTVHSTVSAQWESVLRRVRGSLNGYGAGQQRRWKIIGEAVLQARAMQTIWPESSHLGIMSYSWNLRGSPGVWPSLRGVFLQVKWDKSKWINNKI